MRQAMTADSTTTAMQIFDHAINTETLPFQQGLAQCRSHEPPLPAVQTFSCGPESSFDLVLKRRYVQEARNCVS
jgi:hypothetical protein